MAVPQACTPACTRDLPRCSDMHACTLPAAGMMRHTSIVCRVAQGCDSNCPPRLLPAFKVRNRCSDFGNSGMPGDILGWRNGTRACTRACTGDPTCRDMHPCTHSGAGMVADTSMSGQTAPRSDSCVQLGKQLQREKWQAPKVVGTTEADIRRRSILELLTDPPISPCQAG